MGPPSWYAISMGMTWGLPLLMGLGFLPSVALVFYLRRHTKDREARLRVPFDELRRRPPGESLRLKLADMDDRITERALFLIGLPVMTAALIGQTYRGGLMPPLILFLASVAWTAFYGQHVYRLVRERNNHQLGFDGERFVGEELSRLVARGFQVYHDVEFEGWNIDHVLVGPPGVYAVETKTRRKPVNDQGKKEYRVEFDGRQLKWPWGWDAYGVEQAASNARSLSQWLSGAVGEAVAVTPILTLPGWMVDRRTPRSAVLVFNPKEIIDHCGGVKGASLSDNLIARICYQLDQKCRVPVEKPKK